MKKNIQDFNLLYTILRPLVCWGTLSHYNTFTVRGQENLPREGGCILAPCHQQALMEPLAVLCTVKKPPVYVARADIFKQPTIRTILTFLRIMPVYRIRDGRDTLSKNTEIFEKSRAAVTDGYPFCMMAEGRHNNRHQLLPLVKGMFRIAGETQRQMGNTPVYIVPVGIDFDEYEQTYANVVVNFGKPIAVQPFMELFDTNEPVALNQMRDTVATAMRQQMYHINSSEHYEEIHTLCNILNKSGRRRFKQRNTAWGRFVTRQRIAQTLDRMETCDDSNQQKSFARLMDIVHAYKDNCCQLHIHEQSIPEHKHWAAALLSTLLLAAVVAAEATCSQLRWATLFCLACYPIMIIPTHLIFGRIIKDTQFRSSVNFGVRLVIAFLYTIIFATVMFCTGGGLWGELMPAIGKSPLWGVAALVLPVVLSRLNGTIVVWLRNIWQQWRLWAKCMFSHRRVAELRQQLDEMDKLW